MFPTGNEPAGLEGQTSKGFPGEPRAGLTSGYPEHPHDADDGGVDGKGSVHLDLLQSDAHNGQQDYGQVQLVPPTQTRRTNKIQIIHISS